MQEQRPKCKLMGEDGNIFNLINVVSKCLKENGMEDKATEMKSRIFKEANSYVEALLIIDEYVEVE